MKEGELIKDQAWWFRLEVSRRDLAPWVPIRGDMADDIAFFECLAQVVLFWLRTKYQNLEGGTVSQACDNQATVASLRNEMSTAEPMSTAVQAMGAWKRRRSTQVRLSC